MQINNNTLRGARRARSIFYGAIFGLVGLAAIVFGIYILINPLKDENGNNASPVFSIVAIGLGALFVIASVFSIIKAVKAIRDAKPLTEEQVQENLKKFNEGAPDIPNLMNTKLFFRFGGTMNQSYFVDNKEGKRLYECKLKRFNPVGADTFEFTDVDHQYTKTIKIGKTVTSSVDGGMPFVGDTLTSRFKIDGVMCWEYLRQRGYEIKHYIFERPFMRYELVRLGKLVANIVPANIKDPFNENSKNILRMGRGCYRIEIIDCKLEDAVMAAFIAAKSEMIE